MNTKLTMRRLITGTATLSRHRIEETGENIGYFVMCTCRVLHVEYYRYTTPPSSFRCFCLLIGTSLLIKRQSNLSVWRLIFQPTSLFLPTGTVSSSTPDRTRTSLMRVQKESLQPKPLFFKRMMKGGGRHKRNRRFLTIEILSSKNEYCSDNILEMTSNVRTTSAKYRWTIRCDTEPRGERGEG